MRSEVIVVGASAGGVVAVSTILARLPRSFPAAIFVVIHIPSKVPSSLPEVLGRKTALEVVRPDDGAAIRPGKVYVATSDRHLLLEERRVRVVKGPKEKRHRPAIDPLFRSAAYCHGQRAVGVLLTGADTDGTSGLCSIKERGGLVVVQDPGDAMFPMMPWTALLEVEVDYRLPLKEIPPLLTRLVNRRSRTWRPGEAADVSRLKRRSSGWMGRGKSKA